MLLSLSACGLLIYLKEGSMLKLELINEYNFSSCINIKSSVKNNDYVDDVVYSIAEAYLYKDSS